MQQNRLGLQTHWQLPQLANLLRWKLNFQTSSGLSGRFQFAKC
jgi:hypothetical protein